MEASEKTRQRRAMKTPTLLSCMLGLAALANAADADANAEVSVAQVPIPSVAVAQAAPERITPDDVKRLAVAWTYDARNPTEPLRPGKSPAFEATPVYADGHLYLSTPLG